MAQIRGSLTPMWETRLGFPASGVGPAKPITIVASEVVDERSVSM